MTSLPLAVHTTYQDLLEAHRLRALSEISGSPTLRNVEGKGAYWYARQRIGDRVVDRYLGRDTQELRERIEQAGAGAKDRKAFDQRCASLVAQLRAAGLPTLDRVTGKILNAMAKVGTFRLGGTLVGTHAFRLYGAELGVKLPGAAAVTEDIDIAAFENLKLVIDDSVDPELHETFANLGLQPAPGLDAKHRPTSWIMKGGGAKVDFLVPKMLEEAETILLPPLGVYAQALPFLNFLIAEPIPAVALYRSGVLVQIPRPERFAVHKLIVSQRRGTSAQAKAKKDLAQAEALIDVLAEDRPAALQAAWETAMTTGPSWEAAITSALKQRPPIAEILHAL